MQSYCEDSVVPLASSARVDLVGGKAAGLGALIRAGERVPAGFCVTTVAGGNDEEILAAYQALGGGPVAVRSSATAEDRPDAAFAGQHDTLLNVLGGADLLAAVAACRASLHNARAVAYRRSHHIDEATVRMAVVVQRMVDPAAAGVLFTANPVTGRRTEMAVDAAPGLGTAVVDGSTAVDHYVLDGTSPAGGGCLSAAQLGQLRAAGERVQSLFGAPQDIEWAFDHDGVLWLLQARPITTLFPLPPAATGPAPRVYVEFGHVQGMRQPVTPMGMAVLKRTVAAIAAGVGLRVSIVDIGGRLYGDLSDLARDPRARKQLTGIMAVDFGPRAQAVMAYVLTDPQFAPESQPARRSAGSSGIRTAARALAGITRALARPEAARRRAMAAVERVRLASASPAELTTAGERLQLVEAEGTSDAADDLTWPIVAGILASTVPERLLAGTATPDEIRTVLGGMPGNVTIEMDLALWRIAAGHRDVLLGIPPAELAARYRRGELPEIGIKTFLGAYGHRGVAEADLGVPRWAEDPAPVFAAIANYLRVTDPAQAPDVRFARAAAEAASMLRSLAGRRRGVRGRLGIFLLRRARELAGLREAGKFAGLYRLQAMRQQLLLIGAELTKAGRLTAPDDIMFLTLAEAGAAVRDGVDQRAVAARAREVHQAEGRRPGVPVALYSDGTDVETLLPSAPADGVLKGVGAGNGRATGPARVIRDPATARLEPGDILVTATTDPGWTPLFLTAAALVTETGAIMAHGPTVAREYGIPVVIGVPGATDRITTGQVITVDGAAGTVTP